MNKFNLGDTVTIKSGGTKATVASVLSKDSTGLDMIDYEALKEKYGTTETFYLCQWQEEGKQNEETFPESALI